MKRFFDSDRNISLLLLFAVAIISLPWLGLTYFNTKGEPREAIVALSMLQSGDWVLPVSLGGDIPYKPPFLAWCIAAFSLLFGGISEFVSRLPSALASIGLALFTFSFLRRNGIDRFVAFLTPLICVTTIEVFRASGACRVDMVLTFFMVGSIYMLYGYLDSGKRGLPIGAIAMMTCAVLTKGPVGALLPLLSVGVYAVLSGEKLFSIVWRFALSAILSCVLPAVWYVLAYNQGGDDFLRLALEENFGRLTGTMSYASHEKPIIYNFGTVLLGVLPYTLLPLMALCKVHWRSLRTVSLRTFRERIASMTKIDLFAMVQIVVIFVFYCIPKSKRSVYMLPIYPFIAYFISLLVVYLCNNGAKLLKTFGWIISGVGIVVAVAGVVVSFDVWTAVLVDVIVLLSSAFLARFLVKSDIKKASLATVVNIVFIFVGISASVLPSLQNKKSDVKIARELEQIVPQGDIYQFVDDEMMRYYTINYYLNDRLRVFDRNDNMLPRTGYLLLSEADLPEWKARYENHYSIKTVYKSVSKSCDTKSMVIMVSFVNKNYIK